MNRTFNGSAFVSSGAIRELNKQSINTTYDFMAQFSSGSLFALAVHISCAHHFLEESVFSGNQIQLICNGPNGCDTKLDVFVEFYSQVVRAVGNIVAVDGRCK